MPETALQILIPGFPLGRLIAGLPACLRAAHRAAEAAPGSRLFFYGRDAGMSSRWPRQWAKLTASCVDEQPAASVLSPDAPLLVLAGEGFPEADGLRHFLRQTAKENRAARWLSNGRPVGAYIPKAASVMRAGAKPAEVAATAFSEDCEAVLGSSWFFVSNEADAAAAEASLYKALPKDSDGYLARFDRKLSMALSKLMLRWPITPNHITTASLVLGLLGAGWLASGLYAKTVAGAFLLWVCCLLDGCDGEVARLKLLSSPFGASYDLWADHLAHLAAFVAIPLGVHRSHPQAGFLLPGAMLVSGFLASLFSVWFLVLRKPESERGPHALLIERVASRDYVYLIAAFALIGRLHWFMYAAGLGSHVFWAALWLLPRPSPKT